MATRDEEQVNAAILTAIRSGEDSPELLQPLYEDLHSIKAEQLTVAICAALRSGDGKLQDMQPHFDALLALEPVVDNKQTAAEYLLRSLETILLTAVRCRRPAVFTAWLAKAQPHLLAIASDANMGQSMLSWINNMTFTIVDRRITQAKPLMTSFIKTWWHANVLAVMMSKEEALLEAKVQATMLAQGWTRETLSLIARLARRGWNEESDWLLILLAKCLYQTQDIKVWQYAVSQISLHFIAYAKWDGFASACEAYRKLQICFLLLIRKAVLLEDDKILSLVMRGMREIVVNSARSTMQDDMDIWRAWYEYLWIAFLGEKTEGFQTRRKQELRRMLQLGITFWKGTLPKSSRKQMRFLRDLMEPDVLSDKEHAMLERII